VYKRQIEVQYTGEALASNGDLAPNWRLEQTSNPSDDSTWKVASNDIYSYTEGSGVVHRYVGASDRNVSIGYSTDPNTIQPDSDYYFRASKATDVLDQFGNKTGVQWSPQGNIVHVHTEAYPVLQVKGDGDQVRLSWTNVAANKDVSSSWTGGPVSGYVILRSTSPNSFANSGTVWIESSRSTDFTTVGEANLALLNLEKDSTTGVLGKTETVIQQPKGTTYYYALGALEYYTYQNGKEVALVHRVIGDPQIVISNATTGNLLSDVSLSPSSTITPVKNTGSKSYAPYIANANVSVTLKTELKTSEQWLTQTRLVYGAGGYANSVNCFSGTASSGWQQYNPNKKTVNLTLSNCDSPSVKKMGANPSLRLETDVWTNPNWPNPSVHATYTTPVNFQQIDVPLSAKYSDASISKNKKTTVIVTGFCKPKSYSCSYITGQLQLVNLTTNKVIKTVSIEKSIKFSENNATVKFTFSSKYKGKYKLGVRYTNSPDGSYFYRDTVIKLPTLTVK
jgi:UDP-N-acetylglucosamine transferase subunit ALG13